MPSKKDYTLNEAAFTSTLIQAILEIQKHDENWKYFELHADSPISFKLLDSDENSGFFLSITAFTRDNSVYFTVKYSPLGPHKLGQKEQHLSHQKAFETFEDWLHILKEYDKVIEYSNPNFNQHVKEWVEYFELVDDKADEGLSPDQILLLEETFNQWQGIIEEELSNEGEELCKDLIVLQKSLPKTSKRKFVRNYSRFIVKVMNKSPRLLVKILKFTSKESLKELIQRGTSTLLDLTSNIDI
ncbi:MAG TPA: hypothetical protein VFG10_07245 [Saprospiraceae bacterium]|nr:hypothetical protein [Saprospiraceae bacterium]